MARQRVVVATLLLLSVAQVVAFQGPLAATTSSSSRSSSCSKTWAKSFSSVGSGRGIRVGGMSIVSSSRASESSKLMAKEDDDFADDDDEDKPKAKKVKKFKPRRKTPEVRMGDEEDDEAIPTPAVRKVVKGSGGGGGAEETKRKVKPTRRRPTKATAIGGEEDDPAARLKELELLADDRGGGADTKKKVKATRRPKKATAAAVGGDDDDADPAAQLLDEDPAAQLKRLEMMASLEAPVESEADEAAKRKRVEEFRERQKEKEMQQRLEQLEREGSRSALKPAQPTKKKKEPRDPTKFSIPNNMGVGTMRWGDPEEDFVEKPTKKDRKKYKKRIHSRKGLVKAFDLLARNGISYYDTSELYQCERFKDDLSAEDLVAWCIENGTEGEEPTMVAARYNPLPLLNLRRGMSLLPTIRGGRRAIAVALKASLARLDLPSIELYQVPKLEFPYIGGLDALAEGLSVCVEEGLCKFIGVTDMNAEEMEDFAERLDKYGAKLVSNQVEFSIVNQEAYLDGTIQACLDMGIVPIAHTPLAQGLATGIYTAGNPTGGKMGPPKYNFEDLEPLQPIHKCLERLVDVIQARIYEEDFAKIEKWEDYMQEVEDLGMDQMMEEVEEPKLREVVVSTVQIALNYVRFKGAVPLPGLTSLAQARELVGCLQWKLVAEEVAELDKAYEAYRNKRGSGEALRKSDAPDPRRQKMFTQRTGTAWTRDLE